jgi:hypothetical protein
LKTTPWLQFAELNWCTFREFWTVESSSSVPMTTSPSARLFRVQNLA